MIIPVLSKSGQYNIVLQRGALKNLNNFFNLDRRVLIVTDTGVPKEYSDAVASACKNPIVFEFEQGEASKSLDNWQKILAALVENNFTRTDCIVAVGGGVVGDMAGFAAASFMRGIDFYNIPTTLLSQVDSSIGGKTAVDFMGIKNIVGAFYAPKCVVIDPDTLKTLPKRQIANGLAEAVKMSLTSNEKLFELFENENAFDDNTLDKIIEQSLLIKRSVVEADEKESGLRKILNFGHTLAHAIESVNGMQNLYHGECVALGMLPMCSDSVRQRLIEVLKKLNLPIEFDASPEELINACRHDKKASGDNITVITVEQVGQYQLKNIPFSEYKKIVCGVE